MIGDVWCSSVDKKISFGLGDIFAHGLRVEVIMTTGVLTYATSPSMYFFFSPALSHSLLSFLVMDADSSILILECHTIICPRHVQVAFCIKKLERFLFCLCVLTLHVPSVDMISSTQLP